MCVSVTGHLSGVHEWGSLERLPNCGLGVREGMPGTQQGSLGGPGQPQDGRGRGHVFTLRGLPMCAGVFA